MEAPTPSRDSRRPDRFRWGPALLVGAALAVYFVVNRPVPSLEGWSGDFEAALVEAAASNRKVLVAFGMKGCAACRLMERTVLRTREVRSAVAGFVPVQVDLNDRLDLANRYRVFGAPTYVILDAEGRLLAGVEGAQTVGAFVEFLRRSAATTPSVGSDPGAVHPSNGP